MEGNQRAPRVRLAGVVSCLSLLLLVACKDKPPEPPKTPAEETQPVFDRPPSPIFGSADNPPAVGSDPSAVTLGFVRIPAGVFVMGSPETEAQRSPDESQHKVQITRPFEMQITEVTQGEYSALMGKNPSYHKECGDDCPVEQVSWFEAVEYCNRLSKRRHLPRCAVITEARVESVGVGCRGFRLPTEAEWEYAARAGSTLSRYGDLGQVAWYDKNSGMRSHEVARLKPNAWHLHDMLGNVFEWTWDWMGDYPETAVVDPTGAAMGKNRIFRGGAYRWTEGEARHAFRNAYGPLNKVEYVGFRCVRTL